MVKNRHEGVLTNASKSPPTLGPSTSTALVKNSTAGINIVLACTYSGFKRLRSASSFSSNDDEHSSRIPCHVADTGADVDVDVVPAVAAAEDEKQVPVADGSAACVVCGSAVRCVSGLEDFMEALESLSDSAQETRYC